MSERAPDGASTPAEPEVTEADVLREIQRIAREELELDRAVSAADRLDGALALDSLSRTVLAVGLEDRFRVRLGEADARAPTIGELARAVAARARESSGRAGAPDGSSDPGVTKPNEEKGT